jgi:hypothetical protein
MTDTETRIAAFAPAPPAGGCGLSDLPASDRRILSQCRGVVLCPDPSSDFLDQDMHLDDYGSHPTPSLSASRS